MDKKLNPLDGEIDLLGDNVSDIIRKLNPLTGRLELVYSASSYIQKINPFIGDFDLVSGEAPSYIIKTLTGNGYIDLTNAIANHLIYLKLFGGIRQSNLPEGYTQLEYLRSSGTQYIDLGYKGDGNTKVEIKFKYYQTSSATGSGRIFGSRTSSSSNAFAIGTSSGVVSSTNNKVFWCYDAQSFYVADDVQFGLDEWKTVIFSAEEHKIDGTTYGDDYTITEFETPSNLMLFAFDNNGTIGCGYADVAYCKVWNNGALIRNLVPCKNSSNVFGMYDLVSGTFLTNAGTGDFTAGNNAVPTPDTPMNIVSNNGIIKYSKNMCDVKEENVDVGHYISAQGVYSESSYNFTYIKYIPVKPNTTYTLSFSSPLYFASISEYSTADDNGFVKRNTYYSVSVNEPFDLVQCTVTTDSTTNYIRRGSNMYKNTNLTLEDVLALNYMFEIGSTPTAYAPYVEGSIYTDGTTETVEDELGNTATAEMLLAIGDYKDIQEVINGDITRKIGIKVLTGDNTKDGLWGTSAGASNLYSLTIANSSTDNTFYPISTHFEGILGNVGYASIQNGQFKHGSNSSTYFFKDTNSADITAFKTYLAAQYANGTPVIIVYPLATPTTETVTGQTLNIQAGSNTIEITQASISNLPIEAKYRATS